jgi:hypothetical protein
VHVHPSLQRNECGRADLGLQDAARNRAQLCNARTAVAHDPAHFSCISAANGRVRVLQRVQAMRDTQPDLEVGEPVPEPIVTEETRVFSRYGAPCDEEPPPLPPVFARLGSSTDMDGDEDEPPPLPPVPARGSQQYEVPSVTVLSRVVVPRMRPVPRRAESHTPPLELDEDYETLLRSLG